MIEAADRGAEVVRTDHVVAALRARGMKTATVVPVPAPATAPALEIVPAPATVAAATVSDEVDVRKPVRVEHPTFFARILAWFP
jgi:hypothetical protein